MNWDDVAEVEELSGPEFTHHADSARRRYGYFFTHLPVIHHGPRCMD